MLRFLLKKFISSTRDKPMDIKTKQFQCKRGNTYPSGASYNSTGVNFTIFSRHATKVELLLFKKAICKKPFQTIHL